MLQTLLVKLFSQHDQRDMIIYIARTNLALLQILCDQCSDEPVSAEAVAEAAAHMRVCLEPVEHFEHVE